MTWKESQAIEAIKEAASYFEPGWEDVTILPTQGVFCTVVSSDQINSRHAFPGESIQSVVRRGVIEAASDIAASGAAFWGIQIDIRAPDEFSVTDFRNIGFGLNRALEKIGGKLLQGSNISRGEFGLSSTVFGITKDPTSTLTRRGARPGHLIAVSGPVGAWNAAHAVYNSGRGSSIRVSDRAELWKGFVDYEPELNFGSVLRRSGLVSACLDANDSFVKTVSDLARASETHIKIDVDSVPLSNSLCIAQAAFPELDLQALGLHGVSGDDRLVFSFGIEHKSELAMILKARMGRDLNIVGSVLQASSSKVSWSRFLPDHVSEELYSDAFAIV